MRPLIRVVSLMFLMAACQSKKESLTAKSIVNKAIETSQADKVANAKLSFDFRGRTYTADRNKGNFTLKRITKTDTATITDVLSNTGFKRFLDDGITHLSGEMIQKYSESVNSVHYFSVLPYGLKDAAVNKKRLEDVSIKGKEYYKIEVTFDHPQMLEEKNNSGMRQTKVLIVGAGVTGSYVASLIAKHYRSSKVAVELWDKGRGIGGRMSISRMSRDSKLTCDLGAQYFSVTKQYWEKHKRLDF